MVRAPPAMATKPRGSVCSPSCAPRAVVTSDQSVFVSFSVSGMPSSIVRPMTVVPSLALTVTVVHAFARVASSATTLRSSPLEDAIARRPMGFYAAGYLSIKLMSLNLARIA